MATRIDVWDMLTSLFPLSRGQATFRGLLALILGIVFVVWPGITIDTAVVLFAIYCVTDAALQISSLFSDGETPGHRVLRVFLGIVDLVAAAVAVIYPGPTAGALVIVIGVWSIVGGFAEISGAFTFSSGWLGLTGVLSVAVGIVLIVWPGIGAVSLATVFGIYLAAYGITLLIGAIRGTQQAPGGEPVTAV
jgi:uncharacterized membrane protein HdeD (DUF308 family)